MNFVHKSVLLRESVDWIVTDPKGIYVDCTLGGAGHSHAIAEELDPEGLLIGIDQDEDAIMAASKRLEDAACKVKIVHSNFRNLGTILEGLNLQEVDGIFFDLGVSSYQLDTPERGFSYMHDGPLDMRMDQEGKLTAADVVNTYKEEDLADLIYKYGEERWSRRIAQFIVEKRKEKPLRTTSDVSMMSSVMGYAITGKPLDELEIHAQGFSDEELLDPAVALYAQMYLRTSKTAGNEYFFNLLKDLRDRREEHIEHIRQSLENIKKEMYGMTYRPLDMWDHLDEVLDDPHTLVIANPPTYFSGYEKFYDTQGKMTWKEPEYKLFDPETGHVELFDRCMNANALVVCYQEKRTGEAVGEPIFARAGTRADLNSYITSNRGEEAAALAEGRKIKRPSESKLAPIACSMLPRDYEITEKSKVQIISIKAAEAQYYRQLWTHNFVGSSATFNRAVLIDGMVSGVFGISKMQATSLFIWYVMKVPHTTYRLGRLLYMLAQNHCFTETLLDDLEREKVTKVRTAMLTKYPENKEVRGIMKLVNRQKDKNNGFKLTYEAELTDRTEQETLEEWLRRERQWQKSRKQNMK